MNALRPFALFLILCSPIFARGRVSSYCTQGGQLVVTGGVQSSTRTQQSYPQCSLQVFYSGGPGGFVNTSGTSVTWLSGTLFNANSGWVGLQITINSVAYTIATVPSSTSLTLTGSAGTQTGVAYAMAATTPAAIFSTNTGTALANPFTSTNTGFWAFYADNGAYDITANGGGIPAPFTWGAIQLIDAQNIPSQFSDNLIPYKYSNLQALCTAAVAAGQGITISGVQPVAATFTCGATPAFLPGGIIRPLSGKVVTIPCPAPVPFQVFDTSIGGAGSVLFSTGCTQPLDIRMFGGGTGVSDNGVPLNAIYNAISNVGGGAISYPAGTFAHTTAFTLMAGVPVQIFGAGGGTYIGSSTVAPTLITYSGNGAWFNQNAGDKTDNVVLHDFGYTCSAAGCQEAQIGSFSESAGGNNSRVGWSLYNLWGFGPSGATSASAPGLSLSNLVRCNITNSTFLNWYQVIVWDRTNACKQDSVFIQNYTVGPSVTAQAGSGGAASYGAEWIGNNIGFQGPGAGSGNYSITWDQENITCISCLYENTTATTAWMHNTSNGHNFTDIAGSFSGNVTPTYSMVWDAPAVINLVATACNQVPCPPISSGAPAAVGYGTPATLMGVTGSLYLQCLAVGNSKCQAIGGSPVAYGAYTAITGPLQVDILNSGEAGKSLLNKAGATNDLNYWNFIMPSSDQMALLALGVGCTSESAGAGTVSGGCFMKAGNISGTFNGIRTFSDTHTELWGSMTLNAGNSSATVHYYSGTGSPNGSQTGSPGDIYTNKSGGSGTTLYVKESGSGNTGWVGK